METDFQKVHKPQMLPFKSYYVVWKLPTAIGIIRPAWSLNRTM